jgi:hypothetical protein
MSLMPPKPLGPARVARHAVGRVPFPVHLRRRRDITREASAKKDFTRLATILGIKA